MTEIFPSELGCPLASSYQSRDKLRFERFDVADGPARFRQSVQAPQRLVTVSFFWTEAQLASWEAWHDYTLLEGSEWFEMNLLHHGTMQPMICHLIEGYTIEPVIDKMNHFWTTFQVEAYSSLSITPLPPLEITGPVEAGKPATPSADIIDSGLPAPADVISALNPGRYV